MKLKIQDLDEFKCLSEQNMDAVLKEYKKEYHFLLFYGKFLGMIALILSLGYAGRHLKSLGLFSEIIILIVVSSLMSILIKLVEVNVIAKKVIRDLINDVQMKKKDIVPKG